MDLIMGIIACLAVAWLVAKVLVVTIETIHWRITPWAYKRLTGETLNRRKPRD